MKNLFPFGIKSRKPFDSVPNNTSRRKSFWRLATIFVILPCLFILSACSALQVNQFQDAAGRASAEAVRAGNYQLSGWWQTLALWADMLRDRSSPRSVYQSSGTPGSAPYAPANPVLSPSIYQQPSAPYTYGGGGTPQPTQTTQSCKPNGSQCSRGSECCSGNCNGQICLDVP